MVCGSFTFASDIGAIAALPDFHKEIECDALNHFFCHGYILAPYSIYKGIYKLQPGQVLQLEYPFDSWTISNYWSMEKAAKYGEEHKYQGSLEDATDELEYLLKKSISEQMVADVPVGAFLSGGIDSSTVVALLQSITCGKARTYTIGMNDKDYDEAQIAKSIANILGTNHTELYISEKEAQAVLLDLPTIFSEPFADSSQIPTYLVSKLAHQDVKVALSGDGGDELFAGYSSYDWVKSTWDAKQKIPY